MQEKEIVKAAIRQMSAISGLRCTEISHPQKDISSPNKPDTYLEIDMGSGLQQFAVEVKNELRLHHVANYKGNNKDSWILICQYMSKQLKAILRQEHINYIDASGNCYIQNKDVFVLIAGQKVSAQRRSTVDKLWKASGLRLLFNVLLDPDLLNKTYRHIAEQTRLSLGTVAALMQELEKEPYFGLYKDTYTLKDRAALIKRWSETYDVNLRNKLVQGKFRFATSKDRDNWKNVNLQKAYWGAEPAGALITGFLHPEKFTVYSDLPKTEVMRQLHLIPADDSGDVELLSTFWSIDAINQNFPNVVPPLLAYIELNASFDSRNRETALRIKKQLNV